MLKSLKNRRNRKGFTLAELLIVVAIIAVLVAIAVPLFVGQLGKAEDSVKNANKRAVRGAAVEVILQNEKKDASTDKFDYMLVNGTGDTKATAWSVVAYVSSSGDIHNMTITPKATAANSEDTCEKLSADDDKGKSGEYKVTLEITDLTATGAKGE